MNWMQRAPIDSRLAILRGNALDLGLQAEDAINVALEKGLAAGQTLQEMQATGMQVLEEYEAKLPEWRVQQARQRIEPRMCAADNLARARAAARSNPKNPHEIIVDVEKSGFRLRLTDDGQLQIAPASGLPSTVKAYLHEYREQIVAELRRRTQWAPVA